MCIITGPFVSVLKFGMILMFPPWNTILNPCFPMLPIYAPLEFDLLGIPEICLKLKFEFAMQLILFMLCAFYE